MYFDAFTEHTRHVIIRVRVSSSSLFFILMTFCIVLLLLLLLSATLKAHNTNTVSEALCHPPTSFSFFLSLSLSSKAVPRTPKCSSSRRWSFLPSFGSNNKTFTHVYVIKEEVFVVVSFASHSCEKATLKMHSQSNLHDAQNKTQRRRRRRERRERHKKRALFLGLSECAYARVCVYIYIYIYKYMNE